MKPILSLCIPTYNRSAFLRESLEAALSQIAEASYLDQVEVVVSDNASTDTTAETLEHLRVSYPQIRLRVHRQTENRGPDINIYQTVQMAEGEFAYLVSDDDVLLPGAVVTLMELISEHPDLDAFALNIRSFISSPLEDGPLWFPISRDLIIWDREEALSQFHAVQIMFLSVFAFRRSLALTQDHADRAGTNLLQSYCFIDVLAQGRGLLMTAAPYLAQRKDNTGGWAFWKVMTTNLRDLLDYMERQGFTSAVVARLLALHLRDVYTATRYFKLTPPLEAFTPSASSYQDGIRRLLRLYGLNPYLIFVLIPWMIVPDALAKKARGVYKCLSVRRKATT